MTPERKAVDRNLTLEYSMYSYDYNMKWPARQAVIIMRDTWT